MSYDYALFAHGLGGWDDFVNCFPTVEEAMAAGREKIQSGDGAAHIVHMQERRIILRGQWRHIPSTLTGQPGTTFFEWTAEP